MKAKIGTATVFSLLLAACGGAANDTAAETEQHADAVAMESVDAAQPAAEELAGNVVEVRMVDDGSTYSFEPAKVEVKAGDVVRFVYAGTQPHNVEFDREAVPAGVDLGDYWSGAYLMGEGQTYELKIDDRFTPGTYGYFCTPHIAMNMTGEIVVAN